ncbi:hypothetical protein ACFPK5_07935 [Streptomyces beijiangensis]
MGTGKAELCATPDGRPLYRNLGFVESVDVTRYSAARGTARLPSWPNVREYVPSDWASISQLDIDAYGADRSALLMTLIGRARGVHVAESSGRVVGYGISWKNYPGLVIGPVVAETMDLGLQLISSCVAGCPEISQIDLCTSSPGIKSWLEKAGFLRGDRLPLMTLGSCSSPAPGNQAWIQALASPALC